MFRNTIFTVILLPLIISCTEKQRSADRVVIASVAGERLTLQQAFDDIPPDILKEDSIHTIYAYANQWIQSRVAIDHAQQIGIQNTPDFMKKMDRYRNQLLETLLVEYIIAQNEAELEVSREEAQNYYQTNRDQFLLDEKYIRFRHLATNTRTAAENANREIMAGQDWEEIVERYSVDPELQLRHSTQFWPISIAASDLPPVNQQLRIMGITERSPIIFFRGQYHWVQVMDERREGEYPDLEWLIPQIERWLKLEKSRRLTNAYLRNLYLQAESNNEIDLINVSDLESLIYQ
ncbi:MAG: hypothetical protein EA359_06940 [Balneolaceae bacterium]|nr:MAG: hypothetical protein EA359_06940 [Balneolaceae bacterium]